MVNGIPAETKPGHQFDAISQIIAKMSLHISCQDFLRIKSLHVYRWLRTHKGKDAEISPVVKILQSLFD